MITINKFNPNIRIELDGQDVTKNVISRSLRAKRDLANYSGSIKMKFPTDTLSDEVIFEEIRIYNNVTNQTLLAGVIDNVSYQIVKNETIVSISIGSFKKLTNRRFAIDNASELMNFKGEEIAEGNSSGHLAYDLVKNFFPEITKGYVMNGLPVKSDSTKVDNVFKFKSVYQIVNNLAKSSGKNHYHWTISMDKEFIFFNLLYDPATTHEGIEDEINATNPDIFDITISLDGRGGNYANFYYVIGGINEADKTYPKIKGTSNMYTTISRKEEIEKLGRFDRVYSDSSLRKPEDLQTITDLIVGESGFPYKLSFVMYGEAPKYNEGDFIYANFDFINGRTKFCVDSISIVDVGSTLMFEYSCSRRSTNSPLLGFAESISLGASDSLEDAGLTEQTKRKSQTEISIARKGLLSYIDFSQKDSLVIEGDKIIQAFDIESREVEGISLVQPIPNLAPVWTENGAYFEEGSGQYMGYEQTLLAKYLRQDPNLNQYAIYQAMSIIVVFNTDSTRTRGDNVPVATEGRQWTRSTDGEIVEPYGGTVTYINGIEVSPLTPMPVGGVEKMIALGFTHTDDLSERLMSREQVISIGQHPTITHKFSGHIQAVLIYDRPLEHHEFLGTTAALAQQYGLRQLDQNQTTEGEV